MSILGVKHQVPCLTKNLLALTALQVNFFAVRYRIILKAYQQKNCYFFFFNSDWGRGSQILLLLKVSKKLTLGWEPNTWTRSINIRQSSQNKKRKPIMQVLFSIKVATLSLYNLLFSQHYKIHPLPCLKESFDNISSGWQ